MATAAPKYVRNTTISRQNDDVHFLTEMYSFMQPHKEVIGMSAEILADRFGATRSKLDEFLRRLEAAKILHREMEYLNGKVHHGGRRAHWTLLCDKQTALAWLNNLHVSERNKINRPPVRNDQSIRNRILVALSESVEPFNKPSDLAKAITAPGETVDVRKITRILGGLKDEGKVSFKRDNSGRHHKGPQNHGQNGGVLYDIELRDKPKTVTPEKTHKAPTNYHPVGVDPTNFRNQPSRTIGGPIEKVLPQNEKPELTIVAPPTLDEQFPLIAKMAKRREYLENAAALAEQGGEDDIAFSLLERASAESSPLNTEIMALWEAHKACVQ